MLTGAPAFRFRLVIDLHEQRHINVVGFKGSSVLSKSELLQPLVDGNVHAAKSVSRALACFKSCVSKASGTQL
jgi:hypothetical protein